jgi:hypothetical protein
MDSSLQGSDRGGAAAAALRGWLAALAAGGGAFVVMGGAAALGLHLLGADRFASLLPMTAAVVVLAVGGSVEPSGDVGALGMTGSQSAGGLGLIPLTPTLLGALALGLGFLYPLRRRVSVSVGELLVRAGQTVLVFLVFAALVVWSASDTVTLDGAKLAKDAGLTDKLPKEAKGLSGLIDGLGDVVDTKAKIGFSAESMPTLLGALGFALAVLALALLASRRVPLPADWLPVHRFVRPVVSALVTVLVAAATAGALGGVVAALTGNGGAKTAGGVLLGTPNGVFLALSLGMFVSWQAGVTGQLADLLPYPLDDLLGASGKEQPLTVGRLAELESTIWLLPVAVGLMAVAFGVLAAARTAAVERRVLAGDFGPVGKAGPVAAPGPHSLGWVLARTGAAALTLGVAMPVLGRLAGMKLNAKLSVLGFDAVGGGLVLHGPPLQALALGAAFGAGGGLVGTLLVLVSPAGRVRADVADGKAGAGAGAGAGAEYVPSVPTARPAPPAASPSGTPSRVPPPAGGGAGEATPGSSSLPAEGPAVNPYKTSPPAPAPDEPPSQPQPQPQPHYEPQPPQEPQPPRRPEPSQPSEPEPRPAADPYRNAPSVPEPPQPPNHNPYKKS